MAAAPSIRVVKQFGWRGGNREFGNRYHFDGGTPATATEWEELADAVVAAEAACYSTDVTIVEVIGYAGGTDLAAFSKTYSQQGTATFVNAVRDPGECAIIARYSTDKRTSKNHPIYLFNYYHPAYSESAAPDSVRTSVAGAFQTYADEWLSGFTVGANTYTRCGPDDQTHALVATIDQYVGHRDFPR